jgi:hypothetical protein
MHPLREALAAATCGQPSRTRCSTDSSGRLRRYSARSRETEPSILATSDRRRCLRRQRGRDDLALRDNAGVSAHRGQQRLRVRAERVDRFTSLPPPSTQDVEALLTRTVKRLLPLFESREASWPEDDYEVLRAKGTQLKLPLEEPQARRRGLLAVLMGFSLHADSWAHANDRDALLRLCRYGARGPIAESRLSRREDGRYAYETKKGVTLVMSAEQLVRRLLWLIPPRGLHLTNFHGAFAPHSAEREQVRARPGPQRPGLPAPTSERKSRPRIDWAMLLHRTFGCDVWKCPCGGQRRVVALVTNRRTAEQMLASMKLLRPWPPLQSAQGPPQQQLLPDV